MGRYGSPEVAGATPTRRIPMSARIFTPTRLDVGARPSRAPEALVGASKGLHDAGRRRAEGVWPVVAEYRELPAESSDGRVKEADRAGEEAHEEDRCEEDRCEEDRCEEDRCEEDRCEEDRCEEDRGSFHGHQATGQEDQDERRAQEEDGEAIAGRAGLGEALEDETRARRAGASG
jgi:hypothetical protein